ncbi:MAG: FN3 associated domain-containing protein [Bacteroides sp.]
MNKKKFFPKLLSVVLTIVTVAVMSAGNIKTTKAAERVENPVFSVVGGYYDTAFALTITCSTPYTDIYYIADDTTPFSRDAWDLYTGPIAIATNCTIQAIAISRGTMEGSEIVKHSYNIGSMPAGYVSWQMVLGENTPIAVPTNSPTNLKYSVTTTDEWNQVDKGINLTVTMEVKNAALTVTEAQKQLFANALNGRTLVQYYDINLYKRMGLGVTTKVLNPNSPLNLIMVVPLEAFNTNISVLRIYTMLYEYNGVIYSSPVFTTPEGFLWYNAPKSTTYALVYQDYPMP